MCKNLDCVVFFQPASLAQLHWPAGNELVFRLALAFLFVLFIGTRRYFEIKATKITDENLIKELDGLVHNMASPTRNMCKKLAEQKWNVMTFRDVFIMVNRLLDNFSEDLHMLRRIFQITLILLLPLLSFRSAYAKGAPAMLKIKGPGIPDVLEITDEYLLEPFGWGEFADFDAPIAARTNTEGGYIITRYVLMGGTTMRSLDTFTYYPGSGDEEGIVYYKGIIDKKFIYGGSPQDGKWYRVSARGEDAIQQIFETYNISTGESSTLSFTIPVSIRVRVIYSFILVVAGIAILLFLQRRH